MSRPSKMIVPPVGSSRRATQRAIVDLPQPDSPTTPSVSPAFSVKLTPSTALTAPTSLLEDEPPRDREVLLQALDDAGDLAHAALRARSAPARFCRPDARARLVVEVAAEAMVARRRSTGSSSGSSLRQTSITNSQRGLNGQPLGGLRSDGGWPGNLLEPAARRR